MRLEVLASLSNIREQSELILQDKSTPVAAIFEAVMDACASLGMRRAATRIQEFIADLDSEGL